MDFKENLKTISNIKIYDEYQDFPSLSIPQLFFFTKEEEEKELIKKELSRNLKISELIDEKLDKDLSSIPEPPPKKGITLKIRDEETTISGFKDESEIQMTVMETKLKFLNLKKEKFTSWEDSYNLVIKKLDELTSTPQIWIEERMYSPNWKSGGPSRLIDRIAISTNKIAHQSRIGPGNVVIVGRGILKYLDLNIWPEFNSRFELVIDYNIDPNKVIVLRADKSSQSQVNSFVMAVVYGERDFFWGLPENWEQFASWFWIED